MTATQSIFAFIRHGEYHQAPHTPSAHQATGLTEKGIAQSQQAITALTQFAAEHQLDIDPVIISSGLLRAWQTADEIGQQLVANHHIQHYRIEEHSLLNERSVGSMANLSVPEIEHLFNTDPRHAPLPSGWKSNSDFCLPVVGAESLLDAGTRVADCINQLQAAQQASAAPATLQIIVGHGASFRHAAYLAGVLSRADIAKYSMHYAVPLFFKTLITSAPGASGFTWQKIAGDWKIRPVPTMPNQASPADNAFID